MTLTCENGRMVYPGVIYIDPTHQHYAATKDGPPLRCVEHDRQLALADVFTTEWSDGDELVVHCVLHAEPTP